MNTLPIMEYLEILVLFFAIIAGAWAFIKLFNDIAVRFEKMDGKIDTRLAETEGRINERLARIETDISHIKEQNREAKTSIKQLEAAE